MVFTNHESRVTKHGFNAARVTFATGCQAMLSQYALLIQSPPI